MGHVYVDLRVKGARGDVSLKKVIVDSGASYTVLPEDVVEGVGPWPIPFTVDLELGDGRIVKAATYAAIVELEDRGSATIILSFKNAKTVVGVRTLEDLGLKINPVSGRLEPTRPKGLAYFYYGASLASRCFSWAPHEVHRNFYKAPFNFLSPSMTPCFKG